MTEENIKTEAEENTEETVNETAAEENEEACETAETAEETAEETTEETAEENEAEEAGKEGKKERKLNWTKKFGGKDKKKDEAEEKIKEANDRYTRLLAEFDNYQKRTDKEKTQRYDFGVKDTIEKILPVLDNLERGLAAVPEDKKEDSFVVGMDLVYKQFLKVLNDMGVKPIEAVGQEFNPDFHNAVMHVDDPEAGENIVVQEFQKGYMYKDQVVRYSMVKVAN